MIDSSNSYMRCGVFAALAFCVLVGCGSESSGSESAQLLPQHIFGDGGPLDAVSGEIVVVERDGVLCVSVSDEMTDEDVLLLFPPDVSLESLTADEWRVTFNGASLEIRDGAQAMVGGGFLDPFHPDDVGDDHDCPSTSRFFVSGL